MAGHSYLFVTNRVAFACVRHARFIDSDVPLHIIAEVFQSRHLLRPCERLNSIVVGVVGRALERYAHVRLYAMAFLSNHAHFMLQGPPNEVPGFVGFIKREISRRWGRDPEVAWRGTMWKPRYTATALPTAESQIHCLKYVLSQGVKEGLVAHPEEWPGVHCARSLLRGVPLSGRWLNATGYSRALDGQCRRKRPKPVPREDYLRAYEVRFATIPAWRDLDAAAAQRAVRSVVDAIVAEAATARGGRPPLGRRRIERMPLDHRSEITATPWVVRRRRMICWSSPDAPETREYVARYWLFQRTFREAAIEDAREYGASYPPGAFAPGHFVPLLDRAAAPEAATSEATDAGPSSR
jgi:REP element-mobilizing transposase RayT